MKPHQIQVTSSIMEALEAYGNDEIAWQFPFYLAPNLTMQPGDQVLIRTITADGEENESRGHLYTYHGCHAAAVNNVLMVTIWINRVTDPALTETPF